MQFADLYFWGVLSLFQACLIPGFIMGLLLNLKKRMELILFAFPLSLIFNYLFFGILAILGLYTRTFTLSFFGVELVVLFCLLYKRSKQGAAVISIQTFKVDCLLKPSVHKVLSFLMLGYFFYNLYEETGTIFTFCDTLMSWIPWAQTWADPSSRGAGYTGYYPQLIPLNYSLTYVFIGRADIQFFAKFIAILCPVFTLLPFYYLALIRDDNRFHFGLLTAGLLMIGLNHFNYANHLTSGYVDTPAATLVVFAFFALALIYFSEAPSFEKGSWLYILIASIIIAGAAVTKRTALIAVPGFFAVTLLLVKAKKIRLRKMHLFAILILPFAVIAVPWYFYQMKIAFSMGEPAGCIPVLITTMYASSSPFMRFLSGLQMIFKQLGMFTALLFVGLPFFYGMRVGYIRVIAIFFIIPFFIIWASVFGYELRSLSLIVPLLGFFSGIGLYDLVKDGFYFYTKLARPSLHALKLNLFYTFIIILSLPLLLSFTLSNEVIIQEQIKLRKRIGIRQINEWVFEYLEEGKFPPNFKIASNYGEIFYIPELKSHILPFNLANFDEFERYLEDDNVQYFIFMLWQHPSFDPRIEPIVREKIKQGEFEVIQKAGRNWFFVKKKA